MIVPVYKDTIVVVMETETYKRKRIAMLTPMEQHKRKLVAFLTH